LRNTNTKHTRKMKIHSLTDNRFVRLSDILDQTERDSLADVLSCILPDSDVPNVGVRLLTPDQLVGEASSWNADEPDLRELRERLAAIDAPLIDVHS